MDNTHWEFEQQFFKDQNEMMRATLRQIIHFFLQRLTIFPGLKKNQFLSHALGFSKRVKMYQTSEFGKDLKRKN